MISKPLTSLGLHHILPTGFLTQLLGRPIQLRLKRPPTLHQLIGLLGNLAGILAGRRTLSQLTKLTLDRRKLLAQRPICQPILTLRHRHIRQLPVKLLHLPSGVRQPPSQRCMKRGQWLSKIARFIFISLAPAQLPADSLHFR